MRTAADTNIISAVWSKESTMSEVIRKLGEAKAEGGLVIAAPVYAELLAYPRATEPFLNKFLTDTGVTVDFALQAAVWVEAGRRFARYAIRRRQAAGEGPKRLLVNFIIGAHALLHTDRLITLDPTRYRQDFPELKLITIST